MSHLLNQKLESFATQALSFCKENPLPKFAKVLLQDGTLFAINPKLSNEFPGWFTKQNPATVELHVILDLLIECSERIILTSDTTAEARFLPDVEELIDSLVMGDRGYFKKRYIHQVIKNQSSSCIIKGRSNMNPLVKTVIVDDDGREVKTWRDQG